MISSIYVSNESNSLKRIIPENVLSEISLKSSFSEYVKILFKSFYDIRHYDISMDGCYLEIREVLDQEDKKLIRKYLDEIYNESEILPENFGNEILQEVANCLQEDHYEITKKNVLNEMLWCYMCNMQ